MGSRNTSTVFQIVENMDKAMVDFNIAYLRIYNLYDYFLAP